MTDFDAALVRCRQAYMMGLLSSLPRSAFGPGLDPSFALGLHHHAVLAPPSADRGFEGVHTGDYQGRQLRVYYARAVREHAPRTG